MILLVLLSSQIIKPKFYNVQNLLFFVALTNPFFFFRRLGNFIVNFHFRQKKHDIFVLYQTEIVFQLKANYHQSDSTVPQTNHKRGNQK